MINNWSNYDLTDIIPPCYLFQFMHLDMIGHVNMTGKKKPAPCVVPWLIISYVRHSFVCTGRTFQCAYKLLNQCTSPKHITLPAL